MPVLTLCLMLLAAAMPAGDRVRVQHVSKDESGRWVVVWEGTHLLSWSRFWGPLRDREVRVSVVDLDRGLRTFRLFTVAGDANIGDYRVLDVAFTSDRAAVLITQGGYTWLLTVRRLLPEDEWYPYGGYRDFTDGDGSLGPAAARGEVTIATDRLGEPYATVRLEAADGTSQQRRVRVRPLAWGF